MGLQNFVIASRFITTFCHFTALILCWELKASNIDISLPDNYSTEFKAAVTTEVESALAFGLLCFLWDFAGILFGNSIFIDSVNYFQILVHFCGGLLLSWYIIEQWHYGILWPIIATTCMFTALVEIGVCIGRYGLKSFV